MRVFITGATGLIGNRLIAALRRRGDAVVALSRDAQRARQKLGPEVDVVAGDPTLYGPWADRLDGCQALVNLAGEPIFGRRWNEEQKKRLRASRVDATINLVRAMGAVAHRPQVLVSSSAVGYYGFHGDEELREESPPGSDFLAEICVAWESAASQAQKHAARVVVVRTGVVLDPEGGALAKMLPPFRKFVGGPVSHGRQWISWIHRDDIVGILLFALDRPDVSGVLNGTAPEPERNGDFSRTLAAVLGRPCLFRVPKLALRVRFGDVALLLTEGQRVLPARTQALGYTFGFPKLSAALDDLLHPVIAA